jgi:hypothetical protein
MRVRKEKLPMAGKDYGGGSGDDSAVTQALNDLATELRHFPKNVLKVDGLEALTKAVENFPTKLVAVAGLGDLPGLLKEIQNRLPKPKTLDPDVEKNVNLIATALGRKV